MNFETLTKTMTRAYFIIVTGIVAAIYVTNLIFLPEAVFPASDLGRILLCALLSDLPFVIFYAPKELSKKQMQIRQVIHGIILLAVLITVARLWDWYDFSNPQAMAIYLLQIAAVYIMVLASSYISDKRTAAKLNEGLKKRYQR